jgi:hypothetical protein
VLQIVFSKLLLQVSISCSAALANESENWQQKEVVVLVSDAANETPKLCSQRGQKRIVQRVTGLQELLDLENITTMSAADK